MGDSTLVNPGNPGLDCDLILYKVINVARGRGSGVKIYTFRQRQHNKAPGPFALITTGGI